MANFVPHEPPHPLLFEDIMEWGEEHSDEIQHHFESRGGWEGWAQCELSYNLDIGASREDHAYQNSTGIPQKQKRTDIGYVDGHYIGPKTAEYPRENLLVELKCQGANNPLGFKKGVKEDIAKIELPLNEEWFIREGCTEYVIGLSMDKNGSADMQSLDMKRFESERSFQPPFELWWTMKHHHADHNHPTSIQAALDYELSKNPHQMRDQALSTVRERAARYTAHDNAHQNAPTSYD